MEICSLRGNLPNATFLKMRKICHLTNFRQVRTVQGSPGSAHDQSHKVGKCPGEKKKRNNNERLSIKLLPLSKQIAASKY